MAINFGPGGYAGTYGAADLSDGCWCRDYPKENAAQTPGLANAKLLDE